MDPAVWVRPREASWPLLLGDAYCEWLEFLINIGWPPFGTYSNRAIVRQTGRPDRLTFPQHAVVILALTYRSGTPRSLTAGQHTGQAHSVSPGKMLFVSRNCLDCARFVLQFVQTSWY